MAAIDASLNLACLILWLNWRCGPALERIGSPPISLAGTIKRTDRRRGTRWLSLVVLLVILGARGFFYWHVGSSLSWIPSLELGVVRLPFRSDYLFRMFLFSALSFGLTLGGFYTCLLLLSIVNRGVGNEQPIQRFVRLHLGRAERWPITLKALLPLLFSGVAWILGSYGLARLGILPARPSAWELCEQALVLGVVSYFSWKILVLGLCLLYLLESYLYLGESWVWSYVHLTGANLLYPLRRRPVVLGKVDLSPLLAIGLVLGVSHVLGKLLLALFRQIPW